ARPPPPQNRLAHPPARERVETARRCRPQRRRKSARFGNAKRPPRRPVVKHLLDTSALLAFLLNEPEADRVNHPSSTSPAKPPSALHRGWKSKAGSRRFVGVPNKSRRKWPMR